MLRSPNMGSQLAMRFIDDFAKYAERASESVRQAGPRLA